MVKSVYVHIPFCKSKCNYCSFISFDKLNLKKEYLKALEKEINNNYKNERLNTLYFGGGTPSLLEVSEFENLIKHFNTDTKTEITTELNPEGHDGYGLDFGYLRGLYDIGVNRISLGCQTFNNEVLKLLNRRHDDKQVILSVKNAKNAGFRNINLDFIYGLPEQTCETFISDLKQATDLGITHISFYGLTIEKGCKFYINFPQNLPDEDTQADMYLEGVKFLTDKGYKHYEISNFALDNFESKHNLNYWNNEEYYGFGTGAHGYVDNIRYGNKETIEEYIQTPLERKETKFETVQNKLEEEIFLGFRKTEGINIQNINKKFNIDFDEKYLNIIKKYEGLNLLKKTKQGYALTLNGILVSNTILSEFIE